MIAADRDALLCDLAETYHIYDFKALPVTTLATLSVGLRDDSRIKMHIRGETLTRSELMLAAAVDRLSALIYMQTEDARNGINRPVYLLDTLLGAEKDSNTIQSFNTPVDFEEAWEKITGVKHG